MSRNSRSQGIAQIFIAVSVVVLGFFALFAISKLKNSSIDYPRAAPIYNAVGSRKTAVVLIQFNDLGFVTGNSPTVDSATATMDQIKNFFSENSFNKLNLVGADASSPIKVYGRYILSSNHTCNININEVIQKVKTSTNPSIDLATYDHIIISYAAQNQTTFYCNSMAASRGQKAISGTVDWVTIPDQLFNINNGGWGLISKGLGMNLTANDAHGYNCPFGTNGEFRIDECTSVNNADGWDAMYGATYHFNAYEKENFGWFSASNIVMPGGGTNTYALQPLESNTVQPQIIKILRSTYPSGAKGYIYVENRTQTGFDSSMPSAISGGALLHYVIEPAGTLTLMPNTYLIDANNGGAVTAGNFNDAGLAIGQTFKDAGTGIIIKPVSKVNNVLNVEVTMASTTPTADLKATYLGGSPSDGPITITSGNSVTLNWTSTNASSCTASGGWTGPQPISGSFITPSITQNTTYTIVCGSSQPDSVVINVTPANQPSVDLKVNTIGGSPTDGPLTVSYDSSVVLTWTSQNTTLCTPSGAWASTGTKAVSGTYQINNLVSDSAFTLTCNGVSDTVNVIVTPLPTPTPVNGARRIQVVNTTTNTSKRLGVIGYFEYSTGKYLTVNNNCTPAFAMGMEGSYIGGCGFGLLSDWTLEDYSKLSGQQTVMYSKVYSTTKSGVRFTFETLSDKVDVFTVNGPDRGTADVYVDGVKRASIDNNASSISVNKLTLNLSTYPTRPYIFLSSDGTSYQRTDEMTDIQLSNKVDRNYGTADVFKWKTFNSSSCTASGGWNGAKGLNAEEFSGMHTSVNSNLPSKILPVSYTLTCTTSSGVSKSTSIDVSLRGTQYFVQSPSILATYTKGQTVTMPFGSKESDNSAATATEGFKAQIYILPFSRSSTLSQLALSTVNATYGTNGWTASVKMPTVAGKYRIRIALSCAVANSTCDRKYLGYVPFSTGSISGAANWEQVINVQ